MRLWPQNILFTLNERARTQLALRRDRMAGRDGALPQRLLGDRSPGRRGSHRPRTTPRQIGYRSDDLKALLVKRRTPRVR